MLIAVALLGCPSNPTGQPTDTPGTGSPDDSGASCTVDVSPGGLVEQALTHDEPRSYALFVPTNYDCTPRPLVIGLHGYYGTGRGFAEGTAGLLDPLEEAGWIGVFPDGQAAGDAGYAATVTSFNDLTSRHDTGPDGPTCTDEAFQYVAYPNCGPEEVDRTCRWGTSCADDGGFIRALVAEISTRFAIDADRVVLTGFSQGGQTAAGLACELDDLVSVVAPVHGSAANGYTCAPTARTSLVHVVGRDDTVVDAFDRPSADGMIYDSASETGAAWAVAQGCDDAPSARATPFDGTNGWGCEAYADCATGAEVVVCTWDGGHRWPRQTRGDNPVWATITDVLATTR